MKKNNSIFYYFSLIGQLGLLMIVNMLLFVFLYKFLISKYIIENALVFIFFVIMGVVSGFYSVLKLIFRDKF